ncbi:MAG: type VII toxin-antitoxin system HepT family RNase toxin [Chloroflexia bacterium]
MVDPDRLAEILSRLRGYLEKLYILAGIPRDAFLEDFAKVAGAKYLLQVAIECCLDIAHHIVADEGYRPPADYYDTFLVLAENGIVPETFLPTLRKMVGFRNRLVHLYWEVDEATVYRILQENLGDFAAYMGYILDFARKGRSGGPTPDC